MPSYYKEENGTWTLRYYANINGVNKQHKIRGFAKKQDAINEYTIIAAKIKKGEYYEGTMTVGEYIERWLQHSKEYNRYNTYRLYEYTTRMYIVPHIGKLKLDKLGPLHVQDMLDHYKNNTALSSTTLNRIHATLRSALSQAVRWELISRNVAKAVTPPPNREQEIEAYTKEELNGIFALIEQSEIYLPVLISPLSGLRAGEVSALRWQDVNLEESYLDVKHTLIRKKGEGLKPEPTKTKKSKNIVKIPPDLVAILKKKKTERRAFCLAHGLKFSESDFVCCWADGRPLAPDWVSKKLLHMLRESGITPKRFHDLRHTFCTLLAKHGVNEKVIQTMARHSDPRTTKRYTHVDKDMQQIAAETLGETIFGE